jgi:hypothetical protein
MKTRVYSNESTALCYGEMKQAYEAIGSSSSKVTSFIYISIGNQVTY